MGKSSGGDISTRMAMEYWLSKTKSNRLPRVTGHEQQLEIEKIKLRDDEGWWMNFD